MQRRSKGERLGWKSYSHLPKQQIQIEIQKEFAEALKQELNKMDEYIIINKTALNKKIKELEIKLKEEKDSFLPLQRIIGEDSGKIRALKETLAESTPLTPVVNKALQFGLFSFEDFDKEYNHSPEGRIEGLESIQKDYIKNLKLEI